MGVTSKSSQTGSQGADMNTSESETVVAEMDDGESGTIEGIGAEIRSQVTSMGVRPGQRLEFHTKQPFNGPVVVSVGQSMTSLSREYARKITVSLD